MSVTYDSFIMKWFEKLTILQKETLFWADSLSGCFLVSFNFAPEQVRGTKWKPIWTLLVCLMQQK